ncbi:MAG: LysR family transcriptional regulator [Gammaproteobacteria bacterium]
MTLDQLKVLCTIVETGSFSAAAEKLSRVQSAVSIAIKKLEEVLEIEIFDRQGYRPQLTEAGKEIYRQARNILKQADFLNYTAEQLSIGEEAEIAIAIDGICPLDLFTPVLKVFNAQYPHVRIQLYIEYLGSMERLSQGTVNLALTQVLEWPSWIEAIPWIEISYIPVAAPNHPLVTDGDNAIRNLNQYTQIVVASSQQAPLSINIMQDGSMWQVGDFSSKQQLLIEGFGWGYMPQHMIQSDLDNKNLVILNMKGNKMRAGRSSGTIQQAVDAHKLYLVRRNDRPVGPLAAKFWSLFKEISKKDNTNSRKRGKKRSSFMGKRK